jgi:hypothetical protein
MVVFQTFVLKNVKAFIFEYVIMIEHLTFYVDIVIKRWYSDRVFFLSNLSLLFIIFATLEYNLSYFMVAMIKHRLNNLSIYGSC